MITDATKIPEQSSATLTYEEPDFSVFDMSVNGWSISQSDNIKQEDSMSISFRSIPKYNGSSIVSKQQIKIPWGSKAIRGVVRKIRYTQTGNQYTCDILLGTEKIYLDQEGRQIVGKQGDTIEDALKLIKSKLSLDIDINSIQAPFPTGKIAIDARQNVLKYLEQVFHPTDTPKYNFWIDIFGVLHVIDRSKDEGALDLTHANISPILNSIVFEDTMKRKLKDAKSKTNIDKDNVSTSKSTEDIKVLKYDESGKTTSIYNDKRTVSTSGAGANISETDESVNDVVAPSKFLNIDLTGLYRIDPRKKVKMSGFDIGDGTYKVSGVKYIYSGRPNPSTSISMESATKNIVSVPLTQVDNKNAEPESGPSATIAYGSDGELGETEVVR